VHGVGFRVKPLINSVSPPLCLSVLLYAATGASAVATDTVTPLLAPVSARTDGQAPRVLWQITPSGRLA
jgi:hypothetical protein